MCEVHKEEISKGMCEVHKEEISKGMCEVHKEEISKGMCEVHKNTPSSRIRWAFLVRYKENTADCNPGISGHTET